MKKTLTIASVLLLLGGAVFMCSCANIETRRFATINRTEGLIYCQASGFNTSPFTPEGPFPRWANDVTLIMSPGQSIPAAGQATFAANSDFSSRYDAVESGTLHVDLDRKQVELNVQYEKSYWWNRAKGRFPITEDK